MTTVRYQLSTGDYFLGPLPQQLNTNDDWSMVPSIVGYLGSGLTTTEGVDPRTLTAPDPNPIVSVIVNQTDAANVALGALGGIAEFEGPPNSMIGLGGSDTADAPYLVLYLDSTGRKHVEVSFLARDLEPLATSDSSATQFVVQYRTSTTGAWVNVYYNADITRTPEVSAGGIGVNVALPADADNCATLEVRLMTTNAVGNDEWVGITQISVSSDNAIVPPQGEFVISDVGNLIEGDTGFTAAAFTISRRGGSQGAATVEYRVLLSSFPGGADSADFQSGTVFTGTLSFADGEASKTLTFNILGDTLIEPDEAFSVQLLNPTGGAVLAEGQEHIGSAVIVNDDPKPQISVLDTRMSEGTGSTTHVMTFVIQRVGGSQAFDVDYTTADGTAIAGLDYVATSGTLHFAAGQAEAIVTVAMDPDSLVEIDEDFFLNLSNLSLGFIVDGQGRAVIDNDDFSTQTGTSGDDVMNGFGGDNILVGLAGNDTYFVDDPDDEVHEDAGQGFDAVYTTANFALAANSSVEWLSAYANYAATPLNLTGNDFDQYLLGTEGANILDGKGGIDFMVGFGGDDTYVLDNVGDRIFGEGVGNGYDIVVTTVSFVLDAGMEIEEIRAPAPREALVLTGNEFAQKLIGNSGSSVLDGGGGADFMNGGTGSDTYYVDDAGDVVEETVATNVSFDAVYTSVSYALTGFAHVEWMETTATYGTAAINLTGSVWSQYMIGNQGANVLDGRGGADILLGYGGADSFAFTTSIGGTTGNIDVIVDYQAGIDKILLDDAIFAGIGGPGALAPGVFVTGTAAGDADDRLIYNSSTGQLFYDANGSAAGGAVHFATLQGAPTLTASDFQVI
ncbi:MAG TPA: Calx-beta domain-containing protein [Allosphingosinicella sp.]|nr:Calx-beta domain-containing protein [Allosphingosinicella sp.]